MMDLDTRARKYPIERTSSNVISNFALRHLTMIGAYNERAPANIEGFRQAVFGMKAGKNGDMRLTGPGVAYAKAAILGDRQLLEYYCTYMEVSEQEPWPIQ